ncbi:MAG: sulfatase-like hydrolase/transferase [Thermoleophilaceae bacterium]
MRSNVLWLVLDTARRDAFEPYGAAAGSSPAVSDLARRGVAHEEVHAAGCWTVPSHAAMFTGLLPRAAGLGDAPGGSPFGCKPVLEAQRDRLLPEVMRRAGYATAGVTTNLWIDTGGGFTTGFDDWVSVRTTRQEAMGADTLRVRLGWARQALRAQVDDGAAEAGRVMRGWAGDPPRRPFFWFANLIECHSPYLPPKPWNDLGALDRVRAASEARRHLTLSEIWKSCVGGFDVPEDALARMRHLYKRAIRSMDGWLEELLDALDRASLLDDTLVIVTSDHGENFGEGGLMGHALSLDERLVHVPFVAAGPGAEAFEGMRSLVELPRRVAAAVGLEEHPWHDDLPEDVAVAQFDAIVPPGDPRVDEALEKWGLPADAGARLTTPLTAATDGRLKLLRRGVNEELYDLAADPLELDPLAAVGHDGAVDRLRAALEHPAVIAERPPESTPTDVPADEMEQLEAQMRLLGYL